jgi:hypothetical protein
MYEGISEFFVKYEEVVRCDFIRDFVQIPLFNSVIVFAGPKTEKVSHYYFFKYLHQNVFLQVERYT